MKNGMDGLQRIIMGIVTFGSAICLFGTAFAEPQAQLAAADSDADKKAGILSDDSDFKAAALIEAIILVESGGESNRVGPGGERGLMQIGRDTWRVVTDSMYGRPLPFKKAFDPEVNRQVGRARLEMLTRFLAEHRAKWRSDERSLLLACYNAGHNRVLARGFNVKNMPLSSKDYITRVSALHDHFLAKGRITTQLAMAK